MVAFAGKEAIGRWDQFEVLMRQWRAIEALRRIPGRSSTPKPARGSTRSPSTNFIGPPATLVGMMISRVPMSGASENWQYSGAFAREPVAA